jgi:hypothetical protein
MLRRRCPTRSRGRARGRGRSPGGGTGRHTPRGPARPSKARAWAALRHGHLEPEALQGDRGREADQAAAGNEAP